MSTLECASQVSFLHCYSPGQEMMTSQHPNTKVEVPLCVGHMLEPDFEHWASLIFDDLCTIQEDDEISASHNFT